MTVSSLSYYQVAFGSVIMGDKTPYSIQSIDGLESMPTIRSQDDDRGYLDGGFSGNDFLSARDITINLIVLAGNGNSAKKNANLLKTALQYQQVGVTPLQFQLSPDDNLQVVYGRVRGRQISIDTNFSLGFIVAQFKIHCPDPRVYDFAQQSLLLTPSLPIGRTYPRTYPRVYGISAGSNTGVVVNNGNVTTYPLITITGPAINPTIGNLSTGQTLNFNVTLSATDVLIIDLNARTITLNGVPARNLLTGISQWFAAPVGNSSYYFTATGTSNTTTATIAWNSAYV